MKIHVDFFSVNFKSSYSLLLFNGLRGGGGGGGPLGFRAQCMLSYVFCIIWPRITRQLNNKKEKKQQQPINNNLFI
jgi:hypothetical protein